MNQLASNPIAGSKYKIIDADTHLTEAHDLWSSRAPAKYRDRLPQVKEVDGIPCWVINGDTVMGMGANPASAVLADGGKARSFTQFTQLTLKDLGIITDAFVTILTGTHHPRIAYPKEANEIKVAENVLTIPRKQ